MIHSTFNWQTHKPSAPVKFSRLTISFWVHNHICGQITKYMEVSSLKRASEWIRPGVNQKGKIYKSGHRDEIMRITTYGCERRHTRYYRGESRHFDTVLISIVHRWQRVKPGQTEQVKDSSDSNHALRLLWCRKMLWQPNGNLETRVVHITLVLVRLWIFITNLHGIWRWQRRNLGTLECHEDIGNVGHDVYQVFRTRWNWFNWTWQISIHPRSKRFYSSLFTEMWNALDLQRKFVSDLAPSQSHN